MKIILQRLAQTERRLDQLESSFNECHDRDGTSQYKGPDELNQWYPSPSHSSPRSQLWYERPGGGRFVPEPRDIGDGSRRPSTTNINQDLEHASINNARKLQYLGKAPVSCEEQRLPFPDILHLHKPSDINDIPVAKQGFFDHVGVLYPLICESTLGSATDLVQSQGFHQNTHSCLVLLVIAVVKAFIDGDSAESGLADFQRAMQLRSRLSTQLTLQYVHILVFSAIFLLRKDRLLDFAVALHTGCSMLHTLIKRYFTRL
jgi:hypothetical protein